MVSNADSLLLAIFPSHVDCGDPNKLAENFLSRTVDPFEYSDWSLLKGVIEDVLRTRNVKDQERNGKTSSSAVLNATVGAHDKCKLITRVTPHSLVRKSMNHSP